MDPDELLAEAARQSSEHESPDHAVGALLFRHWEAVSGYATLCTARSTSAGVLTAEAFTRCLGDALRRRGPISAWRPRLLLAAHQVATEWAGDHRRAELAPGLLLALDNRRAAGQGTGSHPGPLRQVAFQAFRSMPEPAQCLLWHTEVESEPASVPVELLGLDPDRATGQLDRLPDLFRSYCLQVHLKLIPDEECRRYARLLDAVTRREGTKPPDDLRQHLAGCPHCAATAEQLACVPGARAVVLAEAVLGWASHQYLDLRAARHRPPAEPPAERSGGRASAGRERRSVPRDRALGVPLRAAALLTGVLTVAGLLSAVLLNQGFPSGTPAADAPAPSGGAPSKSAPSDSAPYDSASPSGAAFQQSGGTTPTALRGAGAGTGLCLDIVGKTPASGADVTLSPCAPAPRQRWSFEQDGRVRNAAAPDLCLDSRPDGAYMMGVRDCGTSGDEGLLFDLTIQGTLVPRGNADLAVTTIASDGATLIVLKARDGSNDQRWLPDGSATTAAESPRTKAAANGQTVSDG